MNPEVGERFDIHIGQHKYFFLTKQAPIGSMSDETFSST